MGRRTQISSSSFGQFMTTRSGRVARVVAGVALIAGGLAMGSGAGYALAAVGLLPLAAGALDRCIITGLAEGRWTGDSVRACAQR